MKLLILCNMIPGMVRTAMGQEDNGGGVWLDHVLAGLLSCEDIQIHLMARDNAAGSGQVSESFQYSLFEEPKPYVYYQNLEEQFVGVLNGFQPDVIHIWGTEYGHTLAMVNAAQRLGMIDSVVVNIQGVCAFVGNHHNEGIPHHVIHSWSLRDILRKDNLYQMSKTYDKRGKLEVQALQKARNVIGRTEWDRAVCAQVNPDLHYYHCNETMRPAFYSDMWEYEKCTKHRVFAPSWWDPSKGFHNLLRAFPEILKAYPDATITVPGDSYFPKSIKQWLRMRAYDKYLVRLTKKLGLRKKIQFMGRLSAEEMKNAFLDANVFVMPSNIENSPNTVCESMLLGVPCVSALVGGIMKMMIHGAEGFIYQPSAEYMLAYYVKEIFGMEERAESIGAAARNHAFKTHDADENLQTLLDIYKKIARK